LDRLERVAKLFVKAGLRARKQSREQDEKINILIHSQMEATGQIIELKGTVRDLATGQANHHEILERLAAGHAEHDEILKGLAAGQAKTEEALRAFLNRFDQGRNGKS
ncbi:MAG TPA: hypothetical protein VFR12_09815, partial [Pyrinomonadaceae bacterium]|nr:hypothetical protein [Pyrinomonadaceae bacterium]